MKLFTILGQPDDPQILVEFDFPDGMQSGLPYKGFQISCSLKDDEDGKLALILMKKFFEDGKLFRVDTVHKGNTYQVVPFMKNLFRERKMNSVMTKLLIASINSIA